MPTRFLAPSEAVALVRRIDTIGLGLISGTPRTLLGELSKRSDYEDLIVSGGLLLGSHELFAHPRVQYRSSFFGGASNA